VTFSETLHEIDEKQSSSSPAAAEAARKQREMDQLPNILKPQSSYMKFKKRAAAELQANRLHASIQLYTQAHSLLLEQLSNDPTSSRGVGSWTEQRRKMADELSRIESNLSYIYAGKLQDYTMALEHANNAVSHFPRWSKAHSRRAVALEGLGRWSDAEASSSKSLEVLKDEASQEDVSLTTMSKTIFCVELKTPC
jgi:tetratricopeptide (TPR) repeat protein